MNSLKSTVLHTIELAVVVGVAIVIMKLLNLDNDAGIAVSTIVIGALAKFARANDSLPIKDWVNEK